MFFGFGGNFVKGLNNGVSDNINSTISTLKDWGDKITGWADNLSIKPISLSATTSLTDIISTDYAFGSGGATPILDTLTRTQDKPVSLTLPIHIGSKKITTIVIDDINRIIDSTGEIPIHI